MSKLILQPTGNPYARKHYNDTIKTPVNLEKISKYLSIEDHDTLKKIYPDNKCYIWGVTPKSPNITQWNKISDHDIALFARNNMIFSYGTSCYKMISHDLAAYLWEYDNDGFTWEYIYFLKNITPLSYTYLEMNQAIGYKPKYNYRGFNVVDSERSANAINLLGLSNRTTSENYSHLMNIPKINFFIKEYKARFDEIHLQEIYKWKAFKHFNDHWDINSPNFTSMLSQALEKTENLLVSGNYWPRNMLIENAELSEKKVKELFLLLIDEEVDLGKRILDFGKGMKEINGVNFPSTNTYQDHRAILVYLSLVYPERYYLYKYTMFSDFAKIIDFNYHPKKGRIENIGQYLNMCDLIRNDLVKDQELLKLHKGRIDEDCYYDSNYNLLTQDFIYAVTYHLSKNTSDNIDDTKLSQNFSFPTPFEIKKQNIINSNNKSNFKPKLIDWGRKQKQNKIDGASGEAYVMQLEIQKLKDLGLKGEVIHTSVEKGDGAGYDIQSIDKNGQVMYIEVKTTKRKCSEPIYISRTELNRSILEKESYYLYRLFNYDKKKNTYEIAFINGDLTEYCQNPDTYKTAITK